MFRIFGLAVARKADVIALGALCAILMGGPAFAQDAAQSAPVQTPYMFPTGAGLILNFIKADKAAEWEGIMQKIKDGLKASEKPERQAQANAWRILKASEPGPSGSIIYFWRIEGGPADVEYSMVKLLTELYPKEARDIYQQYSDAYVPPAQQIMHLSMVNDFAK